MTRNRGTIAAFLCCIALLVTFTVTASQAWSKKGATFDEPLHLLGSWIQVHDFDFRCNPEDPPLWKYLVTAGLPAHAIDIDRQSRSWNSMLLYAGQWIVFTKTTLYGSSNVDVDAVIDAGRARMIVLGFALGALIGWWAWRLAGPMAAVVAVAAFSLDPNFLANAPLVKNDVPIALAFLLLSTVIWRLGERVTIWRILAAGLLMGAALTTKFSGVLAVPIFGIALLIRALLPQPWITFKWTAGTRGQRAAIAAGIAVTSWIIALGVIWAAYGFRFSPTSEPGKEFDFASVIKVCSYAECFAAHGSPAAVQSDVLDQWLLDWHPGLVPASAQWMNRQHILPQAWLEGLVYTYSTSLSRPAFLCGEVRSSGWWYYFPLSMAFKTPLATISAIILAATTPYWWQHRGAKLGWPFIALTALIVAGMPLLLRPFFHAGLREYLPVYSCVIVGLLTAAILGTAAWAIEAQSGELWPVLAAGIGPIIYMMFALRSHLDLGIRHVLPIYPFLFILIGVAGARSRMIWPKTTGTIIVVFILGLAVETFGAYPDFIPFFNVAAGGSRGGLHLLGNSDIDWGQELANLGRWQRAHPNRQLELCYFGFADPAYYGIRSSKFPDDMIRANDGAPEAAASEVFAISAPMLQGSAIDPSQAAYFEPFHHMQPIAVLGGSIYLFDPPPQWVRTAAGGP